MKHHTKSLLFSLLIHSSLLAVLFYLYTTITPHVSSPKEKRICVNLSTIQKKSKRSEPKSSQQPQIKKKKTPQKPRVKKKDLPKKKKSVRKKKKVVKKVSKKTLRKTIEKKVEKPTLLATPPKEVKHEKIEPMVQTAPPNPPQVRECKSKEKIYIEQNINKIASLIRENLYYPRRARKRGIEGTVVVKFFLHKDGSVSDTHVISSQSAILGRAALKTITKLSGEFPKPLEELTLTVPINYELH